MADGDTEETAAFRLITALQSRLASFGRDSAFGDGDFHVFDDYLGGYVVGVIINNPGLAIDAVIAGVREVVCEFPEWSVRVTLPASGEATVRFDGAKRIEVCRNGLTLLDW